MEKDKLNDSKLDNVNGGFVVDDEYVLTNDGICIKTHSFKQEAENETNLDNTKK